MGVIDVKEFLCFITNLFGILLLLMNCPNQIYILVYNFANNLYIYLKTHNILLNSY